MPVAEMRTEIDEAEAELNDVLSYHNVNAFAEIGSLLNDCRNLLHHLAISERLTNRGLTPGWKPSTMDGA